MTVFDHFGAEGTSMDTTGNEVNPNFEIICQHNGETTYNYVVMLNFAQF